MSFISDLFFRKRQQDEHDAEYRNLNSATAKSVLKFLAYGLIHGAASLATQYKPHSKVDEFIAVSGQILTALHRHNAEKYSSDSVQLALHINGQSKLVKLNQMGRDVLLSLDGNTAIIGHTTLAILYAQLRSDMVRHGEIYGVALQSLAGSLHAPD